MPRKITLDRQLFSDKMAKAVKFVPAKFLIPAQENFMFTIIGDKMRISATDGNVECHIQCPVSASENFAFCAPAKLLFGTVAAFRENEVTITMKSDKKIEIKCGRSKYNITTDCMPTEFPIMEVGTPTAEITLKQFDLRLALKSAEKFVDDDSQQANFQGINIAEVDNKIVFCGLTNQVMCRVAIRPMSINHWTSITATNKAAVLVAGLLDDKGEVTVTHGVKRLSFMSSNDTDSFTVHSVTANVNFPDLEKMFNKKPANSVLVNTLEFKDAVRRLSKFAAIDETPKVKISHGENELCIVAADTLTERSGEEYVSIFAKATDELVDHAHTCENLIKILGEIDANDVLYHYDNSKMNIPSFIIPAVATNEENIYTFIIGKISVKQAEKAV
jgi:DNA polymerase-3 subunit beta